MAVGALQNEADLRRWLEAQIGQLHFLQVLIARLAEIEARLDALENP